MSSPCRHSVMAEGPACHHLLTAKNSCPRGLGRLCSHLIPPHCSCFLETASMSVFPLCLVALMYAHMLRTSFTPGKDWVAIPIFSACMVPDLMKAGDRDLWALRAAGRGMSDTFGGSGGVQVTMYQGQMVPRGETRVTGGCVHHPQQPIYVFTVCASKSSNPCSCPCPPALVSVLPSGAVLT